MLTCTLESITSKSIFFRARIEFSVMGYNPLPLSQRKLDTVKLTGQLSVMVLLCCFVHYIVIRVLRRSGLDAPCSCPARCQKHGIDSMKEKIRADSLEKLKSAFKSCALELDIRNSQASEGGGDESQSGYSSPVEDLADLEIDSDQELKDREDLKDRELLEALQRERETVNALYSELEQERNFSATAASEAMAMISRLQEEKAAVQMEARQFERMVLEKAMYDQDAIEALNELLVCREQERIALEEEICLCKEKLDALVKEERRQSLLPEAKADEGRVSPKLESPILVKIEKFDPIPKAGRDEQSKHVDKFSTTSSQLLSALVQDGGRGIEPQLGRRLSNGIRKKGGESEETDGRKPESPEKIVTAPKVKRDEQSKYVDKVSTTKSQLLTALVQDGGRGMEAQLGGRAFSSIRRKGGESEEKDGGKPEVLEKIDTAPKAGRDEQSKYVDKVSTTNSQPLTATVQDGGRGMEAQLGVRVPSAISRKGAKSEEKVGGKPELPGFVSLRRKWGSQEITLKTLEKTKDERRIEDKKRTSVLEYVMKFEQQQQHGVRLPVQMPSVTNHPESAGESRSKMLSDDVDDRTASVTSGGAEPSSSGLTRDDSSRGRSFEEDDCGEEELVNVSSSVEDVEDGGNASSSGKAVEDGGKCEERPSSIIDDGNESRAVEVRKGTEDADECAEESVFVHDIYEVQKSPYRVSTPVMADAEVQSATPSDRLGKPDLQTFERDEARDYLSMIYPSHLHEVVEDVEKDAQWADLQGKLRYRPLRVSKSLGTRDMSRLGVGEGVQELTHRLKALEADKYFMKKTIEALRRENVEMKLLKGLSEQSLELQGTESQEL